MRKETITKFRMTHEMSQKDLAELLNVKQGTLSAYEVGHLEVPVKIEARMMTLIDEFGIDWSKVVPPHKYIAPHKRGPYKVNVVDAKELFEKKDDEPGIVVGYNFKEAEDLIEPKQEPVTKIIDALNKYNEEQESIVLPPASNHYNGGDPNHIDVIKFSNVNFTEQENIGFYRISAIKYIARYGKKNGYNPDDLEKALFYINKLKEATQ